jgi:WD40 repeat protein
LCWRAEQGALLALALAPDGQSLATGGSEKVVRLWQTSNGRLKAELARHDDWVAGLAFTPEGGRLVSAGSTDKMVRVWDRAAGD